MYCLDVRRVSEHVMIVRCVVTNNNQQRNVYCPHCYYFLLFCCLIILLLGMFTLVINGSRSRKQVPYRGHSSLSPENGSRQNEMCEDVFEVSLFCCFAALLLCLRSSLILSSVQIGICLLFYPYALWVMISWFEYLIVLLARPFQGILYKG